MTEILTVLKLEDYLLCMNQSLPYLRAVRLTNFKQFPLNCSTSKGKHPYQKKFRVVIVAHQRWILFDTIDSPFRNRTFLGFNRVVL